MVNSNDSTVANFILLGLTDVPFLQTLYFSLLLTIYILTISGNVLIITVVLLNAQLHSPMYFFLTNLSCIDISLSSSVVPKLLVNTLSHDKSISFVGCAAQVYVTGALGSTECIILAIMAYDRYVAICHPLQYYTVMNEKFCIYLASGTWSVSFLQTLVNEIYMYIETGIIALSSFLLTIISYVYIISSILKITSTRGKYKTFSTCASHFTVVTLFYGNILIAYMHPKSSYSAERDRALSLFYTAVTPMLNPIIYSMRNKVFISSLRNIFNKKYP
ncbi:hypothetical protein GDO86_019683 [Hymenochirus boettgeri]|uniref:G-protein coupled receptors family 1 profile domain-containing protein n=1 Tax=Hymenochirus boettgeri TaxID=247094 RepID=A0A8T2ID73_9PIPI|nr:hypothetical protein GDO86_019683 [Hymenochirus boettgeri]